MALKRWSNVVTGPVGNSMDALLSRYPRADELWISSGMDGDHGAGSYHYGLTYQGSPAAALDIVGNPAGSGLTAESQRRMRDFARWAYDTFGDLIVELIHTTPYPDDDGFYVQNQVKYPGGGPYGNPANPSSTAGQHANHVHVAMSSALIGLANTRLDLLAPAPSSRVFWLDVSNHDRSRRGAALDWTAIALSGAPGVMVAKATEGDPAGFWYSDPWFAEIMAGAKAAGYTALGGYHVLSRGDFAGIARQVDRFRQRLDAEQANWAMVDVEPFDELVTRGVWPTWDDCLRFNERWHQVEQRRLAWYVPQWFWNAGRKGPNLGSPDLRLLQGPLVASAYPGGSGSLQQIYAASGGDSGPGWAPYGNRVPEIWQYTASATVFGASALTDINAFRGTVAELGDLLGVAIQGGQDMAQMLVRFPDGPEPDQVWLVDGMLRRRVAAADLLPGAVANDGVHQADKLGLLGNGGVIFDSVWAGRDAWGVEYPPPAPVINVAAAQIQAAVRAELDATRLGRA